MKMSLAKIERSVKSDLGMMYGIKICIQNGEAFVHKSLVVDVTDFKFISNSLDVTVDKFWKCMRNILVRK